VASSRLSKPHLQWEPYLPQSTKGPSRMVMNGKVKNKHWKWKLKNQGPLGLLSLFAPLYCIFWIPLCTYSPKSLSKQHYMIGITFSKASAQIGKILEMQLYFINENIVVPF